MWKFCKQFLRFFFWKNAPLKLSLLCRSFPKSARASPHTWLTLFQISSKSVHFRRSYCRTCEDRFCHVEYLQYKLFEPITTTHLWPFIQDHLGETVPEKYSLTSQLCLYYSVSLINFFHLWSTASSLFSCQVR